MPTDSIYELTNQLARIRITRQRAVQQIAQSNEQEVALLVRIERVRAVRADIAAVAANDNNNSTVRAGIAVATANDNNNSNPFVVGYTVRIINRLRDEYGIVGVVVTTNRRLVGIWVGDEQRIYTRGWWNLEHHRPASPGVVIIHQAQ